MDQAGSKEVHKEIKLNKTTLALNLKHEKNKIFYFKFREKKRMEIL